MPSIKDKIEKFDLLNIKFYSSKETIKKRNELTEWRIYLQYIKTKKGL